MKKGKNYTISSKVNYFLNETKPKNGWDKDGIKVAKLAACWGTIVLIWTLLKNTGLLTEDDIWATLVFLIVLIVLMIKIYRIIYKK